MVAFSIFPAPLSLRDAMQQLFEESVVPFAAPRSANLTASPTLPIDVYGTADHYTVRTVLPGVLPDNLDLSYHNGLLTLQATIPPQPVPQDAAVTWYRRQLWSGTVSATIQLPEAIDVNRVESSFINGVLTLTLPKAEEARPKKIAINTQTPAMVGAGETGSAQTAS